MSPLEQLLLPDPANWQLETLVILEGQLLLKVTSCQPRPQCPHCQTTSSRIHSYYQRILKDLPVSGRRLTIHLRVRRFYCDNSQCPQTTFAERFGSHIKVYGRRTARLDQILLQLGLKLGGEVGATVARQTVATVSPDTLLRLIQRHPLPTYPTPRVLGVDDFALKKGQVYGTIVVDLLTHRPIELLADRQMTTFAHWLSQHEGIEVISRDRASAYAEAAATSAPKAIQVADRFHLHQSLGETLQRVLRRHYAGMRPVLDQCFNPRPLPIPMKEQGGLAPALMAANQPGEVEATPVVREGFSRWVTTGATDPRSVSLEPKLSYWEKRKVENHQHRLDRYEQVQQLAAAGLNLSEIGRQLRMGPRTVKALLKAPPQPPVYKARPYKLDPYKPYLHRRLVEEGVDKPTQLFREIKAQGYSGCSSAIPAYLNTIRPVYGTCEPEQGGVVEVELNKRGKRRRRPRAASVKLPSVPQLHWWFYLPAQRIGPQQQAAVRALCESESELATSYELTQQLSNLLREGRSQPATVEAELNQWLKAAEGSGIGEWVSLSRGIAQDKAAVLNGIKLSWSQGVVEGTVNRLKLIKRMGYGRSSLELLRKRLLAA